MHADYFKPAREKYRLDRLAVRSDGKIKHNWRLCDHHASCVLASSFTTKVNVQQSCPFKTHSETQTSMHHLNDWIYKQSVVSLRGLDDAVVSTTNSTMPWQRRVGAYWWICICFPLTEAFVFPIQFSFTETKTSPCKTINQDLPRLFRYMPDYLCTTIKPIFQHQLRSSASILHKTVPRISHQRSGIVIGPHSCVHCCKPHLTTSDGDKCILMFRCGLQQWQSQTGSGLAWLQSHDKCILIK